MDVDGILDLQIVQLEVAWFVLVADPDEEQRHTDLGGVMRGLRQVLTVGGHAVGTHDDG